MDVEKAIHAGFSSISALVIFFEPFQKRIWICKMAHLQVSVNLKMLKFFRKSPVTSKLSIFCGCFSYTFLKYGCQRSFWCIVDLHKCCSYFFRSIGKTYTFCKNGLKIGSQKSTLGDFGRLWPPSTPDRPQNHSGHRTKLL